MPRFQSKPWFYNNNNYLLLSNNTSYKYIIGKLSVIL